jgi:recombination protein RecT
MTLKSRVMDTAAEQPADPQAAPSGDTSRVVDLATQDKVLSWLDERRTYFAQALPKHVDERHFIQAAVSAMHGSDALQRCNKTSLMIALMQCAHFGLDPDGVHAAIIPYGNKATFVPMYMGYIELMYRSGFVESVVFDFIREGDEWFYEQGRREPDDFSHRPKLIGQRGETQLAYAFAWMKNIRSQIVFMNREEANEIRDTRSKAYELAEKNRRDNPEDFAKNAHYGKYNSPWHTDYDAMWLKSPVRRLAKRVPTSPELRELIALDAVTDSKVEGLRGHVLTLPRAAWEADENHDDPDAAADMAERQREAADRALQADEGGGRDA